jgi:hypothetical protein
MDTEVQEFINKLLAERLSLLSSSDWTQLPDVPLTEVQKTEWAIYRQKLRDITKQQEFPLVSMPTPPQE